MEDPFQTVEEMSQGGEEDSGEEDEDNKEESDGGDNKEEDNLEFEAPSFGANEMEADVNPSVMLTSNRLGSLSPHLRESLVHLVFDIQSRKMTLRW
ncbi:hypothetical protein PanWU01x14_283000 [Parasponia andersonii]|uniref:Uncharacterized protein n=1 Tax=Parasponia andersonii TaxID=3476 RepID=A0A2P5B0N6_PARAD|nr:hypothetical protein PanWU01x14_283000 [Parasponia andersonii]